MKGFVFGMFFFNTKNGEITRTIASDNEAYGIFVNNSTGATIARNVTANDGEAGIYVGDSENANATVWKNVAYENTFGVFIRDAAHGKVLKNKTFSNCAGILFLNTDETAVPPGQTPGTPLDAEDWLAQGNLAAANNKACPGDPEEGEPPFSGVGIAVLSAIDVRLIDNGVYGNKSSVAPDPNGIPSAGILVVGDPTFKPTSGTKVGFNQALGNSTDILWDEQGDGNKFFANDCLTSQPDGLCEDPDVQGDDNGGGTTVTTAATTAAATTMATSTTKRTRSTTPASTRTRSTTSTTTTSPTSGSVLREGRLRPPLFCWRLRLGSTRARQALLMTLSHPSQAARLMLERKGIDHEVKELFPGGHPAQLRLAGFRRGTVPD